MASRQRWYQRLLHTHRADACAKLLRHGGAQLTIINVPWYVEEPGVLPA